MTYKSVWWSVELPSQWVGYPDGDCSTFHADPAVGVLQISTAHKENEIILDADLTEFAYGRIAPGIQLERITFGAFSGFTASDRKNELSWQEWWLGSKQLMVYVTYNVVHGNEPTEKDAVTGILGSLRSDRQEQVT